MSFLTQLRGRLQQWMYGRNGVDRLSRDGNLLGFGLMLCGSLFGWLVVYWLGLALFVLALLRICSRNITKRTAENNTYLGLKGRVTNWFAGKQHQKLEKKSYRFFKCASCHQTLRLPKGKGKIEITCPKCGLNFVKRT